MAKSPTLEKIFLILDYLKENLAVCLACNLENYKMINTNLLFTLTLFLLLPYLFKFNICCPKVVLIYLSILI